MAIITNKLRRFMAETFINILGSASTNNLYFFFGRSRPWVDNDAKVGFGTLSIPAASNVLTITNGNFVGIPVGSTIKNLNTDEVRQIVAFNSNTEAIVNAEPIIPWSTTNWAWKEPELGNVWKDDNNPPMATGSQCNANDNSLTMLALKKINASTLNDHMSYVIKRYDWDETGSTMYAQYDDCDGDLLLHPTQSDIEEQNRWNSQVVDPDDMYMAGSHWVMVNVGSNFNVFKCLSSGRSPDLNGILLPNKSTEMPDKNLCNPSNNYTHYASDGYVWKFMYSVSAAQALKFLTDNWIPVKTSDDSLEEQWLIQQNALAGAGSIEFVQLLRCDQPVVYYGDTENATTLIPDQSSLLNPSVELQLPNDASVITNYYVGCDVFVYDSEQLRRVVAYDEVNQIITVDQPWTTNPVENDSICIAPAVQVLGSYQKNHSYTEAKIRSVVNLSGYISRFAILERGGNYRTAKIKVTVGVGTEEQQVAFAKPMISPIEGTSSAIIGGHGYDAVKELGGYNLMFFSKIKNLEGSNPDGSYDFIHSNDYRTIGIIRNVQSYDSSTYPVDDTLMATKRLEIIVPPPSPSTFDFIKDEIVYFKSGVDIVAKAYVVEFTKDSLDPTKGFLTIFQDVETGLGVIDITQTIEAPGSGAIGTIDIMTEPEMNLFSGEILYIEQRKPIIRSPQQIEEIKLVVEF